MKILTYTLGFFILFNFPIPIVYNSLILSLIILFLLITCNKSLQKDSLGLIKNKSILYVIILMTFLIPIAVILAIAHESYDFSIIKANILTIITIISTILLYPLIDKYVPNSNNNYHTTKVIEFIIILMAIQSIIEVLAFISPSILNIVRFFQKESVVNIGEGYLNIRGLALTGNPFFSLASAFALTFILLVQYSLESHKEQKKILFYFILIFIGSLFSGRTAFIGILFCLVYFLLSKGNKLKQFFSSIASASLILPCLIIIYNLLPINFKQDINNNLLPFIFEFIYNYSETGKLSTESSNILIEQMYFSLDIKTILFGDGYYTDQNGSYYKNTDSGYMRNILFYGIFGMIYIIYTQCLFLKSIFSIKNYKLFTIIVFSLLLILHAKGETLAHTPIIMAMITLLFIASIRQKKTYEK